MQFVTVILESHAAIGLDITHVYTLVQIHHELAFRVDLCHRRQSLVCRREAE